MTAVECGGHSLIVYDRLAAAESFDRCLAVLGGHWPGLAATFSQTTTGPRASPCLDYRPRPVPRGVGWLLGHVLGLHKNKNNAAATTAATASFISRSSGVRIGLPRRGIHVGLGVGKFNVGRVFIVSSCVILRQPAPRIARFAGFSPADAMRAYPVGPLVSNPRNDGPACLERV